MDIFITDHFTIDLPSGHRFPMEKYRLLRERVQARSAARGWRLREPAKSTREDLVRVHDPAYVDSVLSLRLTKEHERLLGFPGTEQMRERSLRACGATYEACRAALTAGIGVSLSGGTHHARQNRPGGFCCFNDSAVAIRALMAQEKVKRAVIIDLDVHQGDGCAELFMNEPRVRTFSMHGEKNYPFRKVDSSLDVGLADGMGDEGYLQALKMALFHVFDGFDPCFAIYIAGADPYEGDALGRLSLSMAGLKARDELVFRTLLEHEVPVAVTMGGGYAKPIEDTVQIHSATVDAAGEFFEAWRKNKDPREL